MTVSDKKKEVVCLIQHGLFMDLKWCDLAQQADLCKGCAWNQGRGESKWKLNQKAEKKALCG
jgi:hypothetical protein